MMELDLPQVGYIHTPRVPNTEVGEQRSLFMSVWRKGGFLIQD